MIEPEPSENILSRESYKLTLDQGPYAELRLFTTPSHHVIFSSIPRYELAEPQLATFVAWNHSIVAKLNDERKIIWVNPQSVAFDVTVKSKDEVEIERTDLQLDDIMRILYGDGRV